jgi:hypothetical protein
MSQDLLKALMHAAPAEIRKRLGMPARDLDSQVLQLTTTLNGLGDSSARQAILTYIANRSNESAFEAEQASQPLNFTAELVELREWARRLYAPESLPIMPEFLEWARRELRKYREEEILAGIREIETTGGLQLQDFIHELEREATPCA